MKAINWSSKGQYHKLIEMNLEDRKAALKERGYFVNKTFNEDQTIKLIEAVIDELDNDNVKEFEDSYMSIISAQTANGLVVLSNDEKCFVLPIEDLTNCKNVCDSDDCKEVKIDIDDNGATLTCVNEDGEDCCKFDVLAMPENVNDIADGVEDELDVDEINDKIDCEAVKEKCEKILPEDDLTDEEEPEEEDEGDDLDDIDPSEDDPYEGDIEVKEDYEMNEDGDIIEPNDEEAEIEGNMIDGADGELDGEENFTNTQKLSKALLDAQMNKAFEGKEPEEGKEDLKEDDSNYSIEIDWANDNKDLSSEEDVIADVKSAGCPEEVAIKVVDLEGEGGGWPTVKLSGPKDKVDAFLKDHGFEELIEAKSDNLYDVVVSDDAEYDNIKADSKDKAVNKALDWFDEREHKTQVWKLSKKEIKDRRDDGELDEGCQKEDLPEAKDAEDKPVVNEAAEKDKKNLKKELDDIKSKTEDYGYTYFTSMPFSDFDNDPSSFENQYPLMSKIVKSFFKELEILSPEEIDDSDVMDEQWDTDISEHDWDTILTAADQLLKYDKVQLDRIYKNGFNDGLKSDKEILADREKQEKDADAIMAAEEGEPEED